MLNWTEIQKTKIKKKPRILVAFKYYYQDIYEGIARYAKKANWYLDSYLILCREIPSFQWGGDGIITMADDGSETLEYLLRENLPMVNLMEYTDLSGNKISPPVENDNYRIGQLAAEHLIFKGFKNLVVVKRSNYRPILQRIKGFCDTVRKHNFEPIFIDYAEGRKFKPESKSYIAWMSEEIEKLPNPAGIFTVNDTTGMHVLHACLEINIRIPEQIAVIGANNDSITCDLAPIPLTSIDAPMEKLGYYSAQILDNLLHGQALPQKQMVITSGQVVTRQSTDFMAIEHPNVALALKYIWNHYTSPLNLDEVASHSFMSQRRLHDAFVKFVGHSMADEIVRLRIKKAKQLLKQTNYKTNVIAKMSGFSSSEHMCKVFSRILKTTPTSYRNVHFKK